MVHWETIKNMVNLYRCFAVVVGNRMKLRSIKFCCRGYRLVLVPPVNHSSSTSMSRDEGLLTNVYVPGSPREE